MLALAMIESPVCLKPIHNGILCHEMELQDMVCGMVADGVFEHRGMVGLGAGTRQQTQYHCYLLR
jgi:hypothetical protein